MTTPELVDDGRPIWRLYCGSDLVYATTSQDDAARWIAADAQAHTARADDPTLRAEVALLVEKHRELLELMGRGGWTGATGREVDVFDDHRHQQASTDPGV